jgi:hypothetical protein
MTGYFKPYFEGNYVLALFSNSACISEVKEANFGSHLKSMMETKRLQNVQLRDARLLAVVNSVDVLAERFVDGTPFARFAVKRAELEGKSIPLSAKIALTMCSQVQEIEIIDWKLRINPNSDQIHVCPLQSIRLRYIASIRVRLTETAVPKSDRHFI